MTMPATAGSSSRFLAVASRIRHEPSACRVRSSRFSLRARKCGELGKCGAEILRIVRMGEDANGCPRRELWAWPRTRSTDGLW